MNQNKKSSKGSVLIISLWILTILTLMASSLSFYAMLQIKIIRYYMDELQGRYLAQAGIFWTMNLLNHEKNCDYHSLNQNWFNNVKDFKEIRLGNSKFSVFYSEMDSELGLIKRFGIMDEERKININTIPREVLLKLPQATDEIVDAIIDWRDKDNSPEKNGAENEYYQELEIPYPAKNGSFESLEELLLVRDINPSIFHSWKNILTIYGDGKVNINTASRQVLQILGLDDYLIDKTLSFRKGPDGIEGTQDDGVFKEEGAIAKTLFESEILSAREISQLTNLVAKNILGVQSQFFKVESASASSQPINHERKVAAILEHVQNSDVKIKNWMEE